VAKEFNLSQCSAFQIRLAGAKGVLMVNPKLIGRYVKLRRSQVKFVQKDFDLNVVRCATFSQGFLNRQLIILLSALGVPDEVFMKLQANCRSDNSVKCLYKKMVDKAKKARSCYSKKKGKQRYFENLSELLSISLGPSKWFEDILKAALLVNFDLSNDPIFSSILYSLEMSSFLNMKKKARILVPDSCVLIGVVDDQGILEEKEIFVQIKRDNFQDKKKKELWDDIARAFKDDDEEGGKKFYSQEAQIIEGNVIVTRNPCTHPGDVRVLTAVDKH